MFSLESRGKKYTECFPLLLLLLLLLLYPVSIVALRVCTSSVAVGVC